MPLYLVKCENCKVEYDNIWKKMDEVYKCPECGCDTEVQLTGCNIIQDSYSSKESGFGYYDENLVPVGSNFGPSLVESRTERKKLMKKYDVIEAG